MADFWISNAPNADLKKKMLPVVKIQNGGCIQDGVEMYLIFSKLMICQFFFFIYFG
jgi:hypothetical protein